MKVQTAKDICYGAFTDNVSPMNAFKNRYGLIEIDLEHNLKRRLKKSAYWYAKLIKNRVLSDKSVYEYYSTFEENNR